MLTFTINGRPQPKQRPRTVRSGGRVRTYTPKKTLEAERRIRDVAVVTMAKEKVKVTDKNVGIAITFYGARANADIDNLLKTVFDGLNGVVFADDKQVVQCSAEKKSDDTPRTVISVYEKE